MKKWKVNYVSATGNGKDVIVEAERVERLLSTSTGMSFYNGLSLERETVAIYTHVISIELVRD